MDFSGCIITLIMLSFDLGKPKKINKKEGEEGL